MAAALQRIRRLFATDSEDDLSIALDDIEALRLDFDALALAPNDLTQPFSGYDQLRVQLNTVPAKPAGDHAKYLSTKYLRPKFTKSPSPWIDVQPVTRTLAVINRL